MRVKAGNLRRFKPVFWLLSAGWLFGIMVLAGCSGNNELSTDPEAEVRAVITAATKAIEARDIAATVKFISDSYLDKQSQDKSRIKAVLTYIFKNQRTIHLAVRISEVAFPTEEQATVTLYAAMAATPITGSQEFILGRFDFYRFVFTFTKEDESWRVSSAQWRRATRSDLF